MSRTPSILDSGIISSLREHPYRDPHKFAFEIEMLLSEQRTVVVQCALSTELQFDPDCLGAQLGIDPLEKVEYFGASVLTPLNCRVQTEQVECDDTSNEKTTLFLEFMQRYKQNDISIQNHPVRRHSMPIFLEYVFLASLFASKGLTLLVSWTMGTSLDGARLFRKESCI